MKQIKVSDDVYARLKKVADENYRPLGSQIEYFLDATGTQGEVGKIATAQKITEVKTPEKNISGASTSIDDLIKQAPEYDPEVAKKQLSGELNCCLNEQRPCKHWVWDSQTGEGYRNVLSGRYKEAD